MKEDSIVLLRGIRNDPEAVFAEIAARLRNGQADQFLLDVLAQMIDPKSERHNFGFMLVPKRKSAGQPKKLLNLELARFIQERVDGGEKTEAAIALATETFGVRRTACFEAIAEFRASQEMSRIYDELVSRYG